MSVGDDKITFTLTSALKSPLLENTCCRIDVVEEIVQDETPQILLNDALEAVLMLEASEGEGHAEVDSLILELDGAADLNCEGQRRLNPNMQEVVVEKGELTMRVQDDQEHNESIVKHDYVDEAKESSLHTNEVKEIQLKGAMTFKDFKKKKKNRERVVEAVNLELDIIKQQMKPCLDVLYDNDKSAILLKPP